MIDSMAPSKRLDIREAWPLSRKFSELRSQHDVSACDYEKREEGEDVALPQFTNRTYVMCTHCFRLEYSYLEDMMKRALRTEA